MLSALLFLFIFFGVMIGLGVWMFHYADKADRADAHDDR